MDGMICLLEEDELLPCMGAVKAFEIYKAFTFFKALSPALKDPELNTTTFLKKLLEEENYLDAIQFIAHGLEKKEAIAWAYQCVISAQKIKSPELVLVEQWLVNPVEETRLQIGNQEDNFDNPITWLKSAIFWSGSNISAQKNVVIEPASTLSHHGSTVAIILAAVKNVPLQNFERYKTFLKIGIERALGITPSEKGVV
jgi:hypothetical protein